MLAVWFFLCRIKALQCYQILANVTYCIATATLSDLLVQRRSIPPLAGFTYRTTTATLSGSLGRTLTGGGGSGSVSYFTTIVFSGECSLRTPVCEMACTFTLYFPVAAASAASQVFSPAGTSAIFSSFTKMS